MGYVYVVEYLPSALQMNIIQLEGAITPCEIGSVF